jgi:hypothetical protein
MRETLADFVDDKDDSLCYGESMAENKQVTVEIIRELKGYQGRACLVKRGEDYFVVSSADVPYSGPETLVFPAGADGEVASWGDVAGGRGMSRADAIAQLEETGPES